MPRPWEEVVGGIVDGWLFHPQVVLPEVLIVPLENPHLYDPELVHEVFGSPVKSLGVIDLHLVAGMPVGVARAVLGAPAVAMLADAAARRGVRSIIGVGFCGGTSFEVACGELLAASVAYGDSAARAGYTTEDPVGASLGLLRMLPKAINTGPVRSVGAIHLETQAMVTASAADGIMGLDMETAALYAVSAARNIAALTILTVSDHPLQGQPTNAKKLAEGHQAALAAAQDVVQKMATMADRPDAL